MNKNTNVVLLHGWGKYAPEKIQNLAQELEEQGFNVFKLILPGFGNESEPAKTWGIEEYAQWVVENIKRKKIKFPILFGHSFGGQIASFIAAKNLYPISGLVLCASSSIRKPISIHKRFIKSLANTKIIIPLKPYLRKMYIKFYPHSDYHNSSSAMQKILSTVINQDLSGLLPQIKTPTLIIWGGNDHTLPISLAYELQKNIPHSRLEIFPKASHALPYTHPRDISKLLKKTF